MKQQGIRRQGIRQEDIAPLRVADYLAGLLRERGLGAEQLVAATDLAPDLIGALLTGEQVLTADVALSLATFFELSPLLLLEVQSRYHMGSRDHEALRSTLAA